MNGEEIKRQIADRIRKANSILAITHARSDGDGLGCLAALQTLANQAGKTVQLLLPDSLPERYAFLFPADRPACGADFARLVASSDLIVIVDTCTFNQLDGLESVLRANRDKIVVIDHHTTTDDISLVQWSDPTAAAAGIMMTELLETLGYLSGGTQAEHIRISPSVLRQGAHALAVAITSDTGWLRFSNTDVRCLAVMGRLVGLGVQMDKLYAQLFQCDRPQRLKLLARAIDSMELHCAGRLAVMEIRKADFAATGARPDETESIINEPLRIATVDAVILLVEQDDSIRVSLRSRETLDVAAIARQFGGGGHARAAGVRVKDEIGVAKGRLIEAIEKSL
jgi:phosphoesterase RecJ-like protein